MLKLSHAAKIIGTLGGRPPLKEIKSGYGGGYVVVTFDSVTITFDSISYTFDRS